MSGLTPLFYAIYRGIPSIIKILLENHADYKYENYLGYSPFRYALGCLSYANPYEEDLYNERLSVVEILLEKFQRNQTELEYAIIGYHPQIPYLFPLFDFIYYCRIKTYLNLEEIGWNIYHKTLWPCKKTYGNLLIAQNLIVFNQNFEYIIYFFQRMFIDNYKQLILFYLQRIIKDKELINRFLFLIYCSFIEMNGNQTYISMLKYFLDNQHIYLFKTRRDIIKSIINLCQLKPIRLLALCRQKIRSYLKSSIDQSILFHHILPKHLQQYILLDEFNSFLTLPLTNKRILDLIKQTISSEF